MVSRSFRRSVVPGTPAGEPRETRIRVRAGYEPDTVAACAGRPEQREERE